MLFSVLKDVSEQDIARLRKVRAFIKKNQKSDVAKFAREIFNDYGAKDVSEHFEPRKYHIPTEEIAKDMRRYERECGVHCFRVLPTLKLMVSEDEMETFVLLMVSDLADEELE